ncbi:hypothetical protein ABID26_006899 [Mesorhizobium shonense]|uniref:Uncharacterized protein n=1 Tax=Mesorhizobium shonense TaxID=1209948 RepID=A0ABV2I4D0_9HYPH
MRGTVTKGSVGAALEIVGRRLRDRRHGMSFRGISLICWSWRIERLENASKELNLSHTSRMVAGSTCCGVLERRESNRLTFTATSSRVAVRRFISKAVASSSGLYRVIRYSGFWRLKMLGCCRAKAEPRWLSVFRAPPQVALHFADFTGIVPTVEQKRGQIEFDRMDRRQSEQCSTERLARSAGLKEQVRRPSAFFTQLVELMRGGQLPRIFLFFVHHFPRSKCYEGTSQELEPSTLLG